MFRIIYISLLVKHIIYNIYFQIRYKIMKRTLFTLPFLLLLILFSCEYPNDGEYYNKEVTPPDLEKLFPIEMDINSDGEKIIIFNSAVLYFNLETSGLELDLSGSQDDPVSYFSIGNSKLNIYPNQEANRNRFPYYTIIYPYQHQLTEGNYTLKFHAVTLTSGSGSLADKLKVEKYVIEHSWPLEFQDLSYKGTEMMPLSQKISDDGFLQLNWEKPSGIVGLIGYRAQWNDLSTSSYKDTLITNINNTSLTIKDYTCGEVRFEVMAVVKGYNDNYSYNNIKYRGSLSLKEPLPAIAVKDNNDNTYTVSWTKGKYKASYRLIKGYSSSSETAYSKSDTFVVMNKNKSFFDEEYYSLYIYPFGKGQNSSEYNSYLNTSGYFSIATRYTQSSQINFLSYSKTENAIISVEGYNQLISYQLPAFTPIEKKGIIYNTTRISTPTNSSRIAVLNGVEVTIYKSAKMEKLCEFEVETDNSYSFNPYIKACNNNQLYYIYSQWGVDKPLLNITAYDMQKGNKIKNMTTEALYSMDNGLIDVSQDGKYLIISNRADKIVLYDISGDKVVKIKELKTSFGSVYFHPVHPERLVVLRQMDGRIEILEAPSLDRLHAVTFGSMNDVYLYNIDPYTGNILVRGENKFKIIDAESGTIIQTFEDYRIDKLYNNILFSTDGRKYELNK